MKKIFSASFLTIAVVLIIIGTVLILNNTKKGNENEDKNIIYNAVFELDENNRITSFKKNDKEVVVRIITKGSKATFSTELVDNKLTITIDNSIFPLILLKSKFNYNRKPQITTRKSIEDTAKFFTTTTKAKEKSH